MAIHKDVSRFQDRNKIRRMHRQGYSYEQIANTVSITPEHCKYVVEQWDVDAEKKRDQRKAKADAKADLAKELGTPEGNAQYPNERGRIRAEARADVLAEMADMRDKIKAELMAEMAGTPPKVLEDAEKEVKGEAEDKEKTESKKPARRKRKVLAGSVDEDEDDGGPIAT